MNNRRRFGAIASVIALAGTGCSLISDWEQASPGTVVIHSDTQVSFTSNWTCNRQRVGVDSSAAEELAINFELHNGGSFKMCGLGDCVVIEAPDGNPEGIDPDACAGRYALPEPLGDRELFVNGERAEVFDAR